MLQRLRRSKRYTNAKKRRKTRPSSRLYYNVSKHKFTRRRIIPSGRQTLSTTLFMNPGKQRISKLNRSMTMIKRRAKDYTLMHKRTFTFSPSNRSLNDKRESENDIQKRNKTKRYKTIITSRRNIYYKILTKFCNIMMSAIVYSICFPIFIIMYIVIFAWVIKSIYDLFEPYVYWWFVKTIPASMHKNMNAK